MLCYVYCLRDPSHRASPREVPLSPSYWNATNRLSGVVCAGGNFELQPYEAGYC